MTRISICLLCLLLLAGASFAQAVDSVKPECGAAGDRILIRGEDFGDDPSVTIGGEDARVLGSHDDKILVVVPDGVDEGAALISVSGAVSTADFTVLAEDTPVIHHVSATTATAGQRILLIGLRLNGAEVEFVNDLDEVVDTAELIGHWRAAVFKVPDELPAGSYTLRIVNGDLDSGPCSPEIEIVEEGDAEVDSIQPPDQLPGDPVRIKGSNLGPIGFVTVVWSPDEGDDLKNFGISNGFDTIFTRIPFHAEGGATYDVSIELADDTMVEAGSYDVGTPPGPEIDEIKPDGGPAGSVFELRGSGLFALGGKAKVEMTSGDTTIEAKVLFSFPGFSFPGLNSHGDHADTIVARVPEDAADGEYDVTVTVGDQESNAVTFTVEDRPLEIDDVKPDGHRVKTHGRPVRIEGSGFGTSGPISVVWRNGDGDEFPAERIILRFDRLLIVFPPGFPPGLHRDDALEPGDYTIVVTIGAGDDAQSAEFETYTVE